MDRSNIDQFYYDQYKGADWPSYEDFVQGAESTLEHINKEIDQFILDTISQGKRFPIKTATSCQSKWTWSTIYLNEATTASCHRVYPVKFNKDNFENFHNLPGKLNDRRLMLEGKWPTGGCQYCKDIEQAGGWSDRQHNLEIGGLTPPELETNPTAIEVTPRIVEIFAYNTCNFACVYCNSALSSKIEQENHKHGEFKKDGVTILDTLPTKLDVSEYYERFLTWLDNNVHVLRRLHLLGGETFIQHDLMERVFAILEKNPNPNLEFCVFSNLNPPQRYWDLYIKRIQELQANGCIRVFDLTASIDCWGAEAEYTRYGLNLTLFEERMRWASEQGNWLRFNVNQTVTAMTIKTMPDLIEKINKYSQNKHIGHYFQFYTGSEMYQHPKVFSYDTWAADFDRILDTMPKNTVHQLEAIPRMQGLQAQLKLSKNHNYNEIKKLHIYLDEIDRRRKTNWRSVFPYLDI